MDRFIVKRKAEDDHEPSPSSKKTKAAYSFVVAPGASGGDCADLVELLSSLGSVTSVKKWVGNFPSQMRANVELLAEAAAKAKAASSEALVVLVGHSFGCRVICELLATDETFRGAILESYPLYGPTEPKPATDRAVTLRKLPDVPVLFVSGQKDQFLNRTWLKDDAPRGVAALRAVLQESKCKSTVLAVEAAGHNALKVAKSRRLAVAGTVRSAIVKHLALLDEST